MPGRVLGARDVAANRTKSWLSLNFQVSGMKEIVSK